MLSASMAAAHPTVLRAQWAGFTLPRFELRGGVAWHGAGGCREARGFGPTLGVELRTHGRWIVAAGADLLTGSTSCFDPSSGPFDYQGESVEKSDSPYFDASTPRLSGALGLGFDAGPIRFEVTGEAGAQKTKTRRDADPLRADVLWEPWLGGALTLRLPDRLGFQAEVGEHRVATRYFRVSNGTVAAEFPRWERVIRLGITIPLVGLLQRY